MRSTPYFYGSAGKWTSDKDTAGENALKGEKMPLLYLVNEYLLHDQLGWVFQGYSVGFGLASELTQPQNSI